MVKVLSIAVVAALLVGGLGGYRLRANQDKASDFKELSKLIREQTIAVDALTIVNAETQDKQKALLEKQAQTNKAIQGIKDAIKTKPIGGCSLTADADRLRKQAYEATAGSLSK